jgi:phosphoribosylformylglycinamidine synthase subunit PurS
MRGHAMKRRSESVIHGWIPERSLMIRARIHVTLRPSILDPQGKAVAHAIGTLGVKGVASVRMGKYIEVTFEGNDTAAAKASTEEICRKLLANPVMEDYRFDVEVLA